MEPETVEISAPTVENHVHEEEPMAVIIYRCPNCGGELTFDPETQKYRCGYCLSEFLPEEAEKEREAAAEKTKEKQEETEEASVYLCPSCGAELFTESTTAASFCYYCHNPVVFSGRVSGKYLPGKILPFSIDRNTAVERFLKEGKKKLFVPRDFFSKAQIEKITGIYFPYWIYGGDFDVKYRARGRKLRVWRTADAEYTETSIYEVERGGTVGLEGIAHNALKKADRELIESVQPYRLDALQPFSMGYLSGFLAEKRDMEREEFEEETRVQREKILQNLMRSEAGEYTSLTGEDLRVQVQEEAWDYVMLPVWTVTYRGKDQKTYYYAMNGQSGRVSGEFPVAGGRLFLVSALSALAVFALVLAGGYLI